MAYGKEDFVNFSDIEDLDLLLGEFTESEYNFSESDVESDKTKIPNQTKSNTSKSKSKLYQCDECNNSYASISGLRGHLRSKHGKQNIKVSQYRIGKHKEDKVEPFKLDEAEFNEIFVQMVPITVKNVFDNKFHNLSKSVNGKYIIDIASELMNNENILAKLTEVLKPIYHQVLSTAAEADSNTNEALLRSFHSAVYKEDMVMTVVKLCEDLGPKHRLRQFTAVLHRQLISDLIDNRAKLYRSALKNENTRLSHSEQSVLMMIGGYILNQLKKNCPGAEKDVLDSLIKNEKDSEKTFVSKFSEWTEAINRGGLKVPSDKFFLFLRECEICIRKNITEKKISKDSYIFAKELLMENHMVKYYSEKLVSGPLASFVIERSIVIFLNVRGPAAARKQKMEILAHEPESKKSMRKTLQDKTNVGK